MNRSFSFASLVLSYFLVGGGLFAGLLLAGALKIDKEAVVYALMGAGAGVGGFVAARASFGSTILEPAIGAVAVVGTIVGLAAGSAAVREVWHIAPESTVKFVATVGGFATVGAIAGAFISEKVFGEPSASSAAWFVYSAFATFGAALLATAIVTHVATDGNSQSEVDTASGSAIAAAILLAGIGGGGLLAGIAGGALARVRALFASVLGGGAGIAGFYYLVTNVSDTIVGFVVFAIGGAITLIGTAMGWGTVGKRNA
jgi:hypothetical protein